MICTRVRQKKCSAPRTRNCVGVKLGTDLYRGASKINMLCTPEDDSYLFWLSPLRHDERKPRTSVVRDSYRHFISSTPSVVHDSCMICSCISPHYISQSPHFLRVLIRYGTCTCVCNSFMFFIFYLVLKI